MSKKIELANQALPEYLKRDGLNPLGRLYQTLSEGVHSLSDEECLSRAKVTSECLAFLVSELASRKEHRTRFPSIVGQLQETGSHYQLRQNGGYVRNRTVIFL